MKRTFLCAMLLSLVCGSPLYAQDRHNLSKYLYEDTKQLVMLVEDAASLIESKGKEAFKDFGVKGSKWLNDKYYLFVYDLTGKSVFHAIEPGLVGQDLSRFRDLDGRPVIALITDIGKKNQPQASGWVFYLWEDPWKSLVPCWKSSYVRKATAPDGAVYLVGSGLYNMKVEREFLRECIDDAAELIINKGKEAAFGELSDRSSAFHIENTYITVTDDSANILVDPSFPKLTKKRSLANSRDKTGKNIADEIFKGLKDKDRLWVSAIWPKGDTGRLARHMIYVRKVAVGGETFYVFAAIAAAKPIWMK